MKIFEGKGKAVCFYRELQQGAPFYVRDKNFQDKLFMKTELISGRNAVLIGTGDMLTVQNDEYVELARVHVEDD